MLLVKRNQNWVPSMFSDLLENDFGMGAFNNNAIEPAINVLESKNGYIVQVAAPGMTKEDFQVHINQDANLVICMEKKTETKNEDQHYLRHEFSYGKFQQTMLLPDDANRDDISASIQDGVLSIVIPKVKLIEEPKKERLIEIQ